MRGHGRFRGKKLEISDSSASGIFDTFTQYSQKKDSKWPVTLNPEAESFWTHNTNYYQGATATVFPYSWYPASTGGTCANATVGPTFSPTGSGTQSFYHTGGAGSRVCIEESTDGGSTWTNIIDNNTQTTTFTLTYVGGRKYRFKMNVLGGPGSGAGVQVQNWHYTRTSPSNYRVMGIRSAHTDTNG